MRRLPVLLLVIVSVFGLITTGVLAQGGPPSPDATPGAVGVSGIPLGGVDPVGAPGYRLEVVELTWDAGAYVTRHFHPTALITCVQEGALGFTLQHGAASVTRGGTADVPGSPELLALDTEVVLEPRDCITFDELASHMEHAGWNASDGPTVLWEARLVDPDRPFTTYVNDMGTPVS